MKNLSKALAIGLGGLLLSAVQPAFSNMIEVYDQETGNLLQTLEASCSKGTDASGNCVEAFIIVGGTQAGVNLPSTFSQPDIGDEATLDGEDGTGWDVSPSNPANELSILQDLVAEADSAPIFNNFVDKIDESGTSFTSAYQYFSIKQGDYHVFLLKVGRGKATIDVSQGFSHYTNYGDVPLPAAAPLFALALACLGIVSRRRRQSAA